MHQQRIAGVEDDDQVLRASIDAFDAAADETVGEIRRERRPQIGPTGVDNGESRSPQGGFERAANGFDFGKFRHRSKLKPGEHWH